MRRRVLPALLVLAACGEPAIPRVGVVVSARPSAAAPIAAASLPGGNRLLELVVHPGPEPVAADTALAVAERFAADPRVVAVVGHANSAASLAASQVYNRAAIVQVAPTTTSTLYGVAGDFSFRMVPGDDRQAAFIASRGQTGWPPAARIAVVYVNDDYGRSFYRELRPLLHGVVYEGIYGEQSDGAALAGLQRMIGEARPDLLIWLGRPRPLALVLQPLRRALPGLHVLCGDACDDFTVYANAGGAFTGLRFVRFTDPQAEGARLEAFRRAYEATAGASPSSEAILTHDAVLAVGTALQHGARTGEQVRRFLESLGRQRPPLDGLAGPIAFDEAGALIRDYFLADVIAGGVTAVRKEAR